MNKIKVGFVGLGLMGMPMAKNILKNKYPLIVWNRSTKNFKKIKKFGAEICQNLINLPNKCQVIIMMLANDNVCLEVSEVLKKKYKKKSNINRYELHKEKDCSWNRKKN